jgi:ABC-type nitrate/sulfonate/bicarbonate transport system permease component
VSFLVGWQLLIPLLPTALIPTPVEVGEFMWAELRADTLAPETVYQAFAISLRRLVIGFGLALLIGIPIGLLMGLFKRVENFLHDFVVVGLAMPSLVWALIAAMWFGFVERSSIITVLLASVTFVIINVSEGVRAVPKDLLDMSKAYGTSDLHRVRHVVLPSLMPFLFASLRYGLANGWKGLVLAEIYASTSGAGWTIRFWYDARRAQGVIGYALFFMIFALLAERLVFRKLSDRVFRWRPSVGSKPPPEAKESVQVNI